MGDFDARAAFTPVATLVAGDGTWIQPHLGVHLHESQFTVDPAANVAGVEGNAVATLLDRITRDANVCSIACQPQSVWLKGCQGKTKRPGALTPGR